jgi:hypothetical protein
MLENSKDACTIMAEVFAIKQIGLRLNTEVLKSAEFQFEWANSLCDIRARSIFHIAVSSVLAIHCSYFVLPEAG